MKWNIAKARERFSDLIRGAKEAPQPIFNRDRMVAVVIDPRAYEEFETWRRAQKKMSLADSFGELRRICEEEQYWLAVPERRNRGNELLEVLNERSGRHERPE